MIRVFALALATSAAAALAIACGGDEATDDPRASKIGAISENATYAYAEAGADGLYDYLAASVTGKCTAEEVQQDLDGQPVPTGWRQVKDIEFGSATATATVIVITADGDVEQEWSFAEEGDSWRITSIPGLEDCAG